MATAAPTRRFQSHLKAKNFQTLLRSIISATVSLTDAKHNGGTTALNLSAGVTATLPASNGQGARYRIVVGTASNANIVKVANPTDVFVGGILINDIGDTAAATADFFPTASTSDTVSFTTANGGGKAGDWVEFEDIAVGFWAVRGVFQGATDPSTPFSATV